MKYIFTLITLFTLTFSYSQAYQTYTMHFVQVEGDLNAFEEREKLMQKVAQDAVDKGDISFWAFLKRYTGTGYGTTTENQSNYLWVQSNTDISAVMSDKNSWWGGGNIKRVLSEDEFKRAQELNKKFKRVKTTNIILEDQVSIVLGLGSVIQFNFAQAANPNKFIQDNIEKWKPFFQENMPKMGMLNWGVARMISPQGANWPNVSTWDMFDSIESLMKYRVGYPEMANVNPDGPAYNPTFWASRDIFEPIIFAFKEE